MPNRRAAFVTSPPTSRKFLKVQIEFLTFRQMTHRHAAVCEAPQSFGKYDFPRFVRLSEAVVFEI